MELGSWMEATPFQQLWPNSSENFVFVGENICIDGVFGLRPVWQNIQWVYLKYVSGPSVLVGYKYWCWNYNWDEIVSWSAVRLRRSLKGHGEMTISFNTSWSRTYYIIIIGLIIVVYRFQLPLPMMHWFLSTFSECASWEEVMSLNIIWCTH